MQLNLLDEDLRGMIEEADQDRDGSVSLKEFFNIMRKVSLIWWNDKYYKS